MDRGDGDAIDEASAGSEAKHQASAEGGQGEEDHHEASRGDAT